MFSIGGSSISCLGVRHKFPESPFLYLLAIHFPLNLNIFKPTMFYNIFLLLSSVPVANSVIIINFVCITWISHENVIEPLSVH